MRRVFWVRVVLAAAALLLAVACGSEVAERMQRGPSSELSQVDPAAAGAQRLTPLAPPAYDVVARAGLLRATNAGQRLVGDFSARGLHVAPMGDDAGWAFELALANVGCDEALRGVDAPAPTATHNRVEVRHEGGLVEFYANTPSGIEQGFVVPAPLCEGRGDVVLELALGGDVTAQLGDGGRVSLHDRNGDEVLGYGDLVVRDAHRKLLPAGMELVGKKLRIHVDANGAAFPLTVDPTIAVNFVGNGQSGFGGALGQGNLTLSDDGTTLNGTFTRGPGTFADALVIYIDTLAVGISSTASLSDTGISNNDYSRKAISGFNSNPAQRSIVNFPSGFNASYAIALNPNSASTYGNAGNLFGVTTTSAFAWINAVNFAPTSNVSSSAYTFSTSLASLGITPGSGASFRFVATYLNGNTCVRSNEAIGAIAAVSGTNPGYTTVSFTSGARYTTTWLPSHGNGGYGFGGVLGATTSTLALSDDGSVLSATFTKGPGAFSDALVIYIDTLSGGVTSTAVLTDNGSNGDYLRKAISAYRSDTGERSIVNFPSGFNADYAIALNVNPQSDPNPLYRYANSGHLFGITTTSAFGWMNSVNLAPLGTTTSSVYTFSTTLASLGIAPNSGAAIRFVATYLNANNMVRSNEAIGDSSMTSTNPGLATVTFSTSVTYITQAKSLLGVACASNAECVSGLCVDFVCCNVACGGTNPNDCQACSVAAGAPSDGTCTSTPNGSVCTGGTCNAGACTAADAGVDAAIDAAPDAAVDGGADATPEASVDASDGGVLPVDSGSDAAVDAVADAAIDATVDAAVDAAVDSGLDAGTDAAPDAALDAGRDSGVDAAIDAGRDAGKDSSTPLADAANDVSAPPVDAAPDVVAPVEGGPGPGPVDAASDAPTSKPAGDSGGTPRGDSGVLPEPDQPTAGSDGCSCHVPGNTAPNSAPAGASVLAVIALSVLLRRRGDRSRK